VFLSTSTNDSTLHTLSKAKQIEKQIFMAAPPCFRVSRARIAAGPEDEK
jgi:hypothetical protein